MSPAKRSPPSKKPVRKKPAPRKAAKKVSPRKGAPKRARPAKRPAAAQPAPKVPVENAKAKALAHKIANLVLDKKASDVVVLDVRGMTSYADYFVIASGESERQVAAMAEHVETRLREEDHLRPIGTEGRETGNWVLLDYGEVVTHLFFSEVRAFYDLEGLWADAPRERIAEPAVRAPA